MPMIYMRVIFHVVCHTRVNGSSVVKQHLQRPTSLLLTITTIAITTWRWWYPEYYTRRPAGLLDNIAINDDGYNIYNIHLSILNTHTVSLRSTIIISSIFGLKDVYIVQQLYMMLLVATSGGSVECCCECCCNKWVEKCQLNITGVVPTNNLLIN